MKCWLEKNNIDMYSSHNEGESVVDERFIRALKTKIYKYVTSMPKNAYLDKLDDIVNKYNNMYHKIIKMKPVNVKDNTLTSINKSIRKILNLRMSIM